MPAEPLIQCHGLCGTNFVRSCSSQTLISTGSTLMSTLLYASIFCSVKLVSFSGRNVVLAGTSTSMTLQMCGAAEVYSILWLCSSALAVLSHTVALIGPPSWYVSKMLVTVREAMCTLLAKFPSCSLHNWSREHSEDSCHQKPHIWYDYRRKRPGGTATIWWAMHKLTSFLQSANFSPA
jgi:hypothetical protein